MLVMDGMYLPMSVQGRSTVILSGVSTAPVLNPVHFEDHLILVKDACETILANSEFGEWATG